MKRDWVNSSSREEKGREVGIDRGCRSWVGWALEEEPGRRRGGSDDEREHLGT